jgi:hypothetical protein
MPSLRTLLRGLRIAPATDGQTPASHAAETRDDGDEARYLRDPHGMLRMDRETAEAYVAAMSA